MPLETLSKPNLAEQQPQVPQNQAERESQVKLQPVTPEEKEYLAQASAEEVSTMLLKRELLTDEFTYENPDDNETKIKLAGGKITEQGFRQELQTRKENLQNGMPTVEDLQFKKERQRLAHRLKESRRANQTMRRLTEEITLATDQANYAEEQYQATVAKAKQIENSIAYYQRELKDLRGGLGLKNLLNRGKIQEISQHIIERQQELAGYNPVQARITLDNTRAKLNGLQDSLGELQEKHGTTSEAKQNQ